MPDLFPKPALSVDHISKWYRLYDEPIHRLKQAIWRGRRKYYRDFAALTDVSFQVMPGTTLGIIGLNGSGKSTCLQIIAGILRPTTGKVEVNGRLTALLELGAGFNFEYTGRDNALLNGSLLGISSSEMKRLLPEIEEFAGIGQFFDQPLKMYSSGMIVRLAFAVATSVDPDIILIDEALAVGDAPFQARCYQRLNTFRDRGKSIVFVSHDLGAVQQFCDRAILLDKGQVVSIGRPKHVCQDYWKIIRLSPSENTLRVEDTDTTLRYGTKDMTIVEARLNGSSQADGHIFQHAESVCVTLKVRYHKDIERPLVSLVLNTLTGFWVAGTSNIFEGQRLRPHQAGDVAYYEILFPMTLTTNSYYITVGTGIDCGTEGIVRADVIDCAFTFKAVGKVPIAFGVVDLNMKISESDGIGDSDC